MISIVAFVLYQIPKKKNGSTVCLSIGERRDILGNTFIYYAQFKLWVITECISMDTLQFGGGCKIQKLVKCM